jgi:hypothetical protein
MFFVADFGANRADKIIHFITGVASVILLLHEVLLGNGVGAETEIFKVTGQVFFTVIRCRKNDAIGANQVVAGFTPKVTTTGEMGNVFTDLACKSFLLFSSWKCCCKCSVSYFLCHLQLI